MADILKITSPISIKSKVQNLPSKLPTDAVFDITNPNQVLKELPKTKSTDEEAGKQSLLKNLNREIFEPLLNSTKTQAEGMRKLVFMARLFEVSSGILSENFLDKVFVKPQEMLGELLNQEKGATAFRGEFFDSLRMLIRLEGQPKLKEAIVSVLKYFEAYVHQENSLNAIVKQGQDLSKMLPKAEAQKLQQQIETLDTMIKLNSMTKQSLSADWENLGEAGNNLKQHERAKSGTGRFGNTAGLEGTNRREITTYLKNELIPLLGKIAKRHQGSEKIYNQEMNIIHHIVRYDKADPTMLESSIVQFGDEFKRLTKLTDEDLLEMRRLVFDQAKLEQQLTEKPTIDKSTLETSSVNQDDNDVAALLSKALEADSPAKISGIAQNLLLNLVQNESPLIPLLHFIIPFRFLDEDTYGEFFVDKDSRERRGEAQNAQSIFFTIQSDRYGTFEVDLLARDKRIDLDIRCPDGLLTPMRDFKGRLRDIIEEQGFRLSGYQVGIYQESQTILQRYPKLAMRKVGMDVKV